MSMRCLSSLVLSLLLGAPMLPAQRPAGRIGAYTPPRVWPQHPRVFDLLHQRIAIGFDLAQQAK
jgi:hypothetical protein